MIKIGFIGTGNFARQHAEILQELNANIVACYGTNAEKTAAFARDFHCQIYSQPEDFISPAIIDALYIVVPPFAHDGKVELKAIQEKVPFLCEKPVGLNLSLCQEIAEQIKQTNLITSSGYLLRYEPVFSQMKEIIQRNKISTTRICRYSNMPPVHWWRQMKASGGMMVESATHYIDLLRYFFCEIKTVAAFVSTGIAKHHIPDCDLYDSMEAIMSFQSGNIASIGVTHLLNHVQARTDILEIYGQDFVMKADLHRLYYQHDGVILYQESYAKDWQQLTCQTNKKQLLRQESLAFINAIQQKDPSFIKNSYIDAVKSLEIALAMNQSAEQKKIMTLSA